MSWATFTISAVLLTGSVLLALFAVVSIYERERRALLVSLTLALGLALASLGASWLPATISSGLALVGATLAAGTLLYLARSRSRLIAANGRPTRRVDERTIMFARARLEPGSEEHGRYYEEHPDHLESDNRFRRLPGLLSESAKLAERDEFAAAKASFAEAEAMRETVDGLVAKEKRALGADEASEEIKRRVLSLGAVSVGITRLEQYHVYSHIGRGTGIWGEPIEIEEPSWAVAFTVEMDHQTMRAAPAAPVVAESARRYVQAARIAVEVADLVRNWGYRARAHIDGNYRVIAPLVAVDAGLGEIGRMGILMTPRLGPRVRLGVVTTTLPLAVDRPGDDASMLDFCSRCEKCADNCPPGAIAFGKRESVDEGLRWRIDSDTCFRYWNAVGTDCGRCMTVCPFSHPDNPAHDLVRRLISAAPAVRRPLLWADDLFYGRRPEAYRRQCGDRKLMALIPRNGQQK